MKAKELMIGDWVDRNPHCEELAKFVQVTPMMMNFADSDLERIKPIPLTPKILKKNKWINRTDENFCGSHNIVRLAFEGLNRWHPAWRQEIFCIVSFTNGSFGLLITGCFQTIKCVHELQHALRLCGLDELADNFKI